MKTSTTASIRVLFITLIAFISAIKATAQAPMTSPETLSDTEPAELTQLRQQFTLRSLISTRLLADQYTKALVVLEEQASAAGDYDTALASQQRRQQVAKLYANAAIDNADSLVLRPGDAKVTGAIAYDRKENVLESWRQAGCSASWDIIKINPGTYAVTMIYGAPGVSSSHDRTLGLFLQDDGPLPDGEVEFSEVTGLGGSEAEKLSMAVKPTGGWSTYDTVTLGELKLARTSARFMIKVSHLRGNAGLMHLREIRITPAKPAVLKLDATAAKEYAEERQAHAERLTQSGQPIVDAYLARLQTISDDLAGKNDEDGVQAMRNESRRVQQSIQLLGKEIQPEAGIAVSRPDGLDEIRDAHYVPDPTNNGDRFLVSTPNQILSVRLMSVTCPSPLAEDEESHKHHSAYFRITAEDSVAVGRQAREFTDVYLKDRPLRILTRWIRDKSGAIYALVQPGEVGDFSGILVDNGLAAIISPRAKLNSGKRMEETILASLKERETAAKAKAIPPGAWSFLPVDSQP